MKHLLSSEREFNLINTVTQFLTFLQLSYCDLNVGRILILFAELPLIMTDKSSAEATVSNFKFLAVSCYELRVKLNILVLLSFPLSHGTITVLRTC